MSAITSVAATLRRISADDNAAIARVIRSNWLVRSDRPRGGWLSVAMRGWWLPLTEGLLLLVVAKIEGRAAAGGCCSCCPALRYAVH